METHRHGQRVLIFGRDGKRWVSYARWAGAGFSLTSSFPWQTVSEIPRRDTDSKERLFCHDMCMRCFSLGH